MSLDRPILFIGVPRSGTTILFEAFRHHEALGYLVGHSRFFRHDPRLTGLYSRLFDHRFWYFPGKKPQGKRGSSWARLGARVLPRPWEGWPFWNRFLRPDFSHHYLLGERAAAETRAGIQKRLATLLRFAGKRRFAQKFTGPGKVSYLDSLFPDAVFVHILREVAPVVNSLLRVEFWRRGGGYERPWWDGGLDDELLARWRRSPCPETLAAIQWMRIIETTRAEAAALAPDRYFEIHYEDFVREPAECLAGLFSAVGLPPSRRALKQLELAGIRDMNSKAARNLSAEQLSRIREATAPRARSDGGLLENGGLSSHQSGDAG